jgi:hypothetical protein
MLLKVPAAAQRQGMQRPQDQLARNMSVASGPLLKAFNSKWQSAQSLTTSSAVGPKQLRASAMLLKVPAGQQRSG